MSVTTLILDYINHQSHHWSYYAFLCTHGRKYCRL